MGRPNKKTEAKPSSLSQANIEELQAAGVQVPGVKPKPEVKAEEKPDKNPDVEEVQVKEDIPMKVLELMKIYPQYQKFWVTSKGFVHPENAPAYLTKGATLYENKYFKQ